MRPIIVFEAKNAVLPCGAGRKKKEMVGFPKPTLHKKWIGFTLIELLVVVAIIAILVGILLPAITRAKQRAIKVACSAHLRQVGQGIQMYRQQFADRFPVARYMPLPFMGYDATPDPPLYTVLKDFMGSDDSKVYQCQGDRDFVFRICGSSFYYNTHLCGRRRGWMRLNPVDIAVCYDCDGYTFELETGSIAVPPFHALRNLLFADGHVGNYVITESETKEEETHNGH